MPAASEPEPAVAPRLSSGKPSPRAHPVLASAAARVSSLLSHVRLPDGDAATGWRGWERAAKLATPLLADSPEEVRDFVTALVLSECVYKRPASEVAAKVAEYGARFPPGLAVATKLQLSSHTAAHRCLLAEGPGALYVAFLGTKAWEDLVLDADATQATFEEAAPLLAAAAAVDAGRGPPASPVRLPRVHRGFLARARGVPVVHLYAEARRRKLRLVLCGHSLGGAVASVAAVRLLCHLRALPPDEPSHGRTSPRDGRRRSAADDALSRLRVISFAQPPVGDAALAALVRAEGWESVFRGADAPEDPVPRILAPRARAERLEAQRRAAAAAAAATAADAVAAAARVDASPGSEAPAAAAPAAAAAAAAAETAAVAAEDARNAAAASAAAAAAAAAADAAAADASSPQPTTAAADASSSASSPLPPPQQPWHRGVTPRAALSLAARALPPMPSLPSPGRFFAPPSLPSLPSLPSYHPFGKRAWLLPAALVPRHVGTTTHRAPAPITRLDGGAVGTAEPPSPAPAPLPPQQQPRNGREGNGLGDWGSALRSRFAAHKMRSYRARVEAIVAASLGGEDAAWMAREHAAAAEAAAAAATAAKAAAAAGRNKKPRVREHASSTTAAAPPASSPVMGIDPRGLVGRRSHHGHPPHPLPFARIAPEVGPIRAAVAFVPLSLIDSFNIASSQAPAPPPTSTPPPPPPRVRRGAAPQLLRVELRGDGLCGASVARCFDAATHRPLPAFIEAPEQHHQQAHGAAGAPVWAPRGGRLRCWVALPPALPPPPQPPQQQPQQPQQQTTTTAAGGGNGPAPLAQALPLPPPSHLHLALPHLLLSLASDFEECPPASVALVTRIVALRDPSRALPKGGLESLARALAAAAPPAQGPSVRPGSPLLASQSLSSAPGAAAAAVATAAAGAAAAVSRGVQRTAAGATSAVGAAAAAAAARLPQMQPQLQAAAQRERAPDPPPLLSPPPATWQPFASQHAPPDGRRGEVCGRGVCFRWEEEEDDEEAAETEAARLVVRMQPPQLQPQQPAPQPAQPHPAAFALSVLLRRVSPPSVPGWWPANVPTLFFLSPQRPRPHDLLSPDNTPPPRLFVQPAAPAARPRRPPMLPPPHAVVLLSRAPPPDAPPPAAAAAAAAAASWLVDPLGASRGQQAPAAGAAASQDGARWHERLWPPPFLRRSRAGGGAGGGGGPAPLGRDAPSAPPSVPTVLAVLPPQRRPAFPRRARAISGGSAAAHQPQQSQPQQSQSRGGEPLWASPRAPSFSDAGASAAARHARLAASSAAALRPPRAFDAQLLLLAPSREEEAAAAGAAAADAARRALSQPAPAQRGGSNGGGGDSGAQAAPAQQFMWPFPQFPSLPPMPALPWRQPTGAHASSSSSSAAAAASPARPLPPPPAPPAAAPPREWDPSANAATDHGLARIRATLSSVLTSHEDVQLRTAAKSAEAVWRLRAASSPRALTPPLPFAPRAELPPLPEWAAAAARAVGSAARAAGGAARAAADDMQRRRGVAAAAKAAADADAAKAAKASASAAPVGAASGARPTAKL